MVMPTLRRLTNNLRLVSEYYEVAGETHERQTLQQMWVDQTSGTEHWEDVPIVAKKYTDEY